MIIILGILLIVIGALLIYWNIDYSPYKKAFNKQMKERVDKIDENSRICTKEEIESLPEPMKKYCNYIGLEGTKKYQVAHIFFPKTKFVFDSQSGKTLDMDYDLWLLNDKPFRQAYCQSSMFGVPFDGIDYSTEQQEGGMKGILGKTIQIFDVKNKQGYQAGLISWVAECAALNPAALLSEYVQYEEMDSTHVKATINYNGVSGSGVFTFDENGAITEFYSNERQVEKVDGVDTKVGWLCEYIDYKKNDLGMRIQHVKSTKIFPDGRKVVYFDAKNFVVKLSK